MESKQTADVKVKIDHSESFAEHDTRRRHTVARMSSAANDTSHDARLFVYKSPLDVPRVAEYCHIPSKVIVGDEGEVPNDYVLTSVHMMIRHGDRTPMTALLNLPYPSPPEGCTMDPGVLRTVPELQGFVADMESQRESQPPGSKFSSWSLLPQHSQCIHSQLTGQGAFQHLLGGLALKEKYVKKWRLFGGDDSGGVVSRFSLSSRIRVKSTQVSRTYQSAVAFLYGFLPQLNVSQLEIQATRDIFFCSPAMVPTVCCDRSGRMKKLADDARPKAGENPKWSPTMSAFADVLGVNVGKLPGPTALVDILQGHACHGVKLPCGAGGKCVTAAMMRELWELVDGDGRLASQDARFDRYSRALVHSLLLEISTNMAKASHNQSPVKFTLYSGHDLTVTPMLQTLGLYDGKWPRYATRIVFELYRKLRARGEHFVRVVHNGRDVTSLVRFCRGKMSVDGMCALKHLQDFLHSENVRVILGENQRWESFCRS